MRMTEYLSKIAPNTTHKFLSEIMYKYGIGASEFESKTLYNRLIKVREYFGYSMTISDSLSEQDMKDEIIKLFTEYEELIIGYPDGVPDFMAKIKNMTNAERSEYIDKNYKRQVNISLSHSLIKFIGKRSSLRDAIIDRVLTQLEQMSREKALKEAEEEKFWNDIVKNFDKSLVPPF
jgi:hypothetical protein